ncbi:MAG: ABC transporter permease [Theionarchaea archaeon]|nr:ABC transporter permease [Theionarchaea archaeon]
MNVVTITRFELKKLLKQRLVHASYVLVCSITVLFFILNYFYGPTDRYSGFSLIMENLQVLNDILFILPLIGIVLTVASISWERSSGTLRMLLTRPVQRETIIIGKFLALLCIMSSLYFLILVLTVILGLNWGYGGEFMDFIPRIFLIFLEYILGTMIFVSLTGVITFFVPNHLLALLLSLGLNRLWLVLDSLEGVNRYLFSYHISTITQLMMGNFIDYSDLYQSQIVICVYVLGIMLVLTTLWEKRDLTV